MDDASFQEILLFFNLSWTGYRRVRKGVKKRITRHMQEYGLGSVVDYLHLLKEDPDAVRKARELLTVSISRFFRDRRLWDVLDRWVVPKLLLEAAMPEPRPVRAWSAGCACGEECYSLRILWDQAGKRFSSLPYLEVWATDMNPEVLERARVGVYPPSSLKGLSYSEVQESFLPDARGFAISEKFKEGIHWRLHDFVADMPPEVLFDLVFLRNNLFTYFESPVQELALRRIVPAMRPGGFLVVGNKEIPPLLDGALSCCPQYRCIFEKQLHHLEDP
jgi:chemotaxis protein methyltransferase CheR